MRVRCCEDRHLEDHEIVFLLGLKGHLPVSYDIIAFFFIITEVPRHLGWWRYEDKIEFLRIVIDHCM